MIIAVVLLSISVLILFLYIIFILKQLKSISKQLDKRLIENTRQPLNIELFNKTITNLSKNIKLIHKFYPSVGFSNQMIFIYLAKKLEKLEDKQEEQQIEIKEIDFDEVYKMVLNNEIVDGKTSLGILLSKDLIK